MKSKLTIYFDDPFWVGVFERIDDDMLETAKVVFGSEPKDYEVYSFILENYNNLKFSRPFSIELKAEKKINPKRLQRIIREETVNKGIGTKAQQAMQLEYEANKVVRKAISKEQREEMKRLKFDMRQDKKKEKKKGH